MTARPKTPPRIGRPPSEAAASHAAILDAVYELLQEKSARDLTMEAVAKRAGVGKPTLYKWWPTKAALIFAMFHERIVETMEAPRSKTAEATIRAKVRHLIKQVNGLFGKVMADLIAEAQSDPAVMQELYDRHISLRRASTIADIERGKTAGEFRADVNAELLVDAIFAPLYYQLLLRRVHLTQKYGDELIDQVLRGLRTDGA